MNPSEEWAMLVNSGWKIERLEDSKSSFLGEVLYIGDDDSNGNRNDDSDSTSNGNWGRAV